MKKMDEIAKKGYAEFDNYYLNIAHIYRLYGDNVLNVEFDGVEEEFKIQFKKYADNKNDSKISSLLHGIWMEQYQRSKIIKSEMDILPEVYPMLFKQGGIILCSSETADEYPLSEFVIDEEYFRQLEQHITTIKHEGKTIDVALQEVHDRIYIIELGKCPPIWVRMLGYYPKECMKFKETK